MSKSDQIQPALFQAVRANDVEAVRAAIVAGEDVNVGAHGRTPLSLACEIPGYEDERAKNAPPHESIVRLLLDAKADPNLHDGNAYWAPLTVALRKGTRAMVDALLEAGAELEASELGAAMESAPELAAEILKRKPEQANELLLEAAGCEDPESALAQVKALLAVGADPNAMTRGCSAVHCAAAVLNGPVLAALIAANGSLELASTERYSCSEEATIPKGATPRSMLAKKLKEDQRTKDIEEFDDVKAQWKAIAKALGVKLPKLLERLEGDTPRTPKKDSPFGVWVAVSYEYESSPDGDPDYYPTPQPCDSGDWSLVIEPSGEVQAEGPSAPAGRIQLAPKHRVLIDGDACGEYDPRRDSLLITLQDEEHGSEVHWMFERA